MLYSYSFLFSSLAYYSQEVHRLPAHFIDTVHPEDTDARVLRAQVVASF